MSHSIEERYILFKKILDEIEYIIARYQSLCQNYDYYIKLYEVIEALMVEYNNKFTTYKFYISKIEDSCNSISLDLVFNYWMTTYFPNQGHIKEFQAIVNMKLIIRNRRLQLILNTPD